MAQNRLVCLQDIVFLKILKSVCGKFHKLWTFWCGLRFFTFWHFFTRTKQKSQKQLVLKKKERKSDHHRWQTEEKIYERCGIVWRSEAENGGRKRKE